MTNDAPPVVVGIDGSEAAITAALWAVDEAVARDVPLRLVYVTGQAHDTVSAGPSADSLATNDVAVEYGETALRAASSAVSATGRTVKQETEILRGPIDDTLIAESRSAALLCVASVGIGWVAEKVLGSTAAAVSRDADCPVVVVRYPSRIAPTQPDRWIVVGIDDRPGSEDVVRHAVDEARVRHAAVLAVATWSSELSGVSYSELDHRCETWRQRYPDVHIHPTATAGGLPEFLVEKKDHAIELAVVCAADAREVTQIIGPHGRSLVPYGQCSVMVVH